MESKSFDSFPLRKEIPGHTLFKLRFSECSRAKVRLIEQKMILAIQYSRRNSANKNNKKSLQIWFWFSKKLAHNFSVTILPHPEWCDPKLNPRSNLNLRDGLTFRCCILLLQPVGLDPYKYPFTLEEKVWSQIFHRLNTTYHYTARRLCRPASPVVISIMKLVIVVTLFVIVLVGMTHGKYRVFKVLVWNVFNTIDCFFAGKSHKVEEPDSKNRTQHSSNHATHKIEKVPQRNGTKVHRGTGREARQIGYGGNYGGLSSQLGGICKCIISIYADRFDSALLIQYFKLTHTQSSICENLTNFAIP